MKFRLAMARPLRIANWVGMAVACQATLAQSWICDSPVMTDQNVVQTYSVTTVSFAYCALPGCDGTGDTLHMNVYLPQTMSGSVEKPAKFPLLVFFTGGGFWQGNFNIPQWPDAFVKRGFVVATPQYRLGWDRNNDGVVDSLDFSPDIISGHCEGNPLSMLKAVMRGYLDADAAIRFLLGDPDIYPIDTDLIFVGGPSAGGSLAMTLGFSSWPQLVDYWNEFSGGQPYETEPCNMRYEVRPCPLLGAAFTGAYHIRGVVNCWGQAIVNPTLDNDPGEVALFSAYASTDNVNPPDVGHTLSCPDYPLGMGGRAMRQRMLHYGRCVKTFEDPDAHHKTVFLSDSDTLYDDVTYPLSVQRGDRARFIAAQASCLFKSSVCGIPCTDTAIYSVADLRDWLQAYYAVNGQGQGEPAGCDNRGVAEFLAILPGGGFGSNNLLAWPNPTAGDPISVAWNSTTIWGQCTISDVAGRVVFDEKVKNRSTITGTRFLPPGYYNVRVEDSSNSYTTRCLVLD